MHFYNMSYSEVMSLGILQFWFMNSCIDRIRAESDMRGLRVAAVAAHGSGFKDFAKSLEMELGSVMKQSRVLNDERDEAGIQKLRAMTTRKRG